MMWREVKQEKPALAHKGNAGGSRNSGSMNGKGDGQVGGHKVSTFYIQMSDMLDGGCGAVVPKGSTVHGEELSSIQRMAEVGQVVDDVQSQEGSMSTPKLEKALGDLSQGESMSSAELKKALEELGEEEEVSKEESFNLPNVDQLVAVPEASLEQSSAGWSKHRAREIDEVVGASTEWCKAFRNEDNSDEPTQSLLVNDFEVISHLDNIGISLRVDRSSINESSVNHKNSALGCLHERAPIDLKDKVLEKAKKEVLEEEELEKLF
jgi:hypothetical protein